MNISNPKSVIKVKSSIAPKLSAKLSSLKKAPKVAGGSLNSVKVPKGSRLKTPNFAKMMKPKAVKLTKITVLKKAVKAAKPKGY